MLQSEGLVASDLLAAFVACRVLLLQGRPHLICQMSGRHDPSRLSTKEMPRAEVANLVNHIAHCEFEEGWQFGKELYSRDNPPPVVSRVPLSFCLFSQPTSASDSCWPLLN